MATLNTLEQFLETIEALYSQPGRTATTEGIKKDDLYQSLVALANYVKDSNAGTLIQDSIQLVRSYNQSTATFAESAEQNSLQTSTDREAIEAIRSAIVEFTLASEGNSEKTAADRQVVEGIRDAGIIQPGVYETEAAGRAAVADGQAFKVQGSGLIAAYEYRRINSSASQQIATYPSGQAADTWNKKLDASAVSRIIVFENLFNKLDQRLNKAITNYTPGTGGQEVTAEGWILTGRIPFPASTNGVLTKFASGGYNGRLHAFNSSDVYLGEVVKTDSGSFFSFTSPATTDYLKCAIANSVSSQPQADSFMLLKGNVYPFQYVPYSAPVVTGVDKVLDAPLIASLIATDQGPKTFVQFLAALGVPAAADLIKYVNKVDDITSEIPDQLFYPNVALQNQSILSNTGQANDGSVQASVGQWWSGYISINPLKGNIAKTIISGGANSRFFFYNSSYEFISKTNSGLSTAPIPLNASYVAFIIADNVARWDDANSIMLNYGTVPLAVGSAFVKKVAGKEIAASKIITESGIKSVPEFIEQGGYLNRGNLSYSERIQLFKPDTALQNQSILSSTGNSNDGSIVSSTGQWWSGYIPIDPSKANIARTIIVGGANGRFYFYDSNFAFISKTNSGLATAPIPGTAAYLAFIIADNSAKWGDANLIMVNYGTTPLPYIAYGSELLLSKLDGRALLASKIATDLGDRTLLQYLIEKGLLTAKLAVTLLKPAKVYSICNDTRPLSLEHSYGVDLTSSIYIDHMFNLPSGNDINAFVKENGTDRFNFSSPKSVDGTGAPVYNNGSDIATLPRTFTVTGDIVDQVVSFNHVSVRASYLKSKMIRHLRIGDSTGYGTSTALIDVPDGVPSKVSDFMLVYMERLRVDAGNPATEFIYKPLGTKYKRQIDFSYRGVTKTLQSYTESQGSWAATDYYLFTDRLTTSLNQGIWDRLGLGNGSGSDYTGTVAQKSAIFTTPEGKFSPNNTSAFISHMNTFYGGITTYAQAVAKQNDLLINPLNPFFDGALTGEFRFSLAKYLERYKTLSDDGVARLIVGATAGTKVTNVNDYDVCMPTHITISLGTNDHSTNQTDYLAAINGIVGQIKSYNPDIIVCLAMIDYVGTYFPKRYPQYVGSTLYDNYSGHSKAITFNQQLMALENAANKIFYLPNFFVQPTAEGVAVKKTPRAKSLSGLASDTDMMYSEWGKNPSGHPNSAAYAEIGVSELSALVWTKQYMP